MNLTEQSAVLLLDWLLGGAPATRPSERWCGLASGVPNSRFASEISAASYSRQTVSFAPAASPAGTASNRNALQFGPFGSWATVQGLQVWDGSGAGAMMLWQGLLETPRTMVPNDTLDIAAGFLTCGIS
jgi:hypothetical protein